MESNLFTKMAADQYENIFFCYHQPSGLKAVIVIHSTVLGPAGGGVRMFPYRSEEAAIEDALRLARAMTFKFAAAGLNVGGGKTVIIGDPKTEKSEALFRVLGKFINRLGGLYYAGEDVGTTPEDMSYLAMETPYVANPPEGSLAPLTAFGVLCGMKACARELFGSAELEGRTVAVQGCGSVGQALIELLSREGARLIVADVDEAKVKKAAERYGARPVAPDAIFSEEADIFSPCALGGVLNEKTVPALRCKIVAGSANNQLAENRNGDLLYQRGILYAPDFVINAGGAIYGVTRCINGETDLERIKQRVAGIGQAITEIINISKKENIPTYQAAERFAGKRLETARLVRGLL